MREYYNEDDQATTILRAIIIGGISIAYVALMAVIFLAVM